MRTSPDVPVYDAAVKQQSLGESHRRLLALVGHNQTVLEVGPASGYMTRVLSEELGCTVDCVEIDPSAAASAQEFARRMIVGSAEDHETLNALDGPYDVAILGDVLEHLRHPDSVLMGIREKLKHGGRVIASIPNVAHWTVRLALLRGRFEYTPTGLLDETHVRFFTLATACRLFEDTAYQIITLQFTRGPLPQDRWLRHGPLPLDKWLRADLIDGWLIRQFPRAFAFQFIIEAKKI